MWLQIVVGLVTVIGSMAMLFSPETSWNAPAAVLMGLGLGLVTPEFLMMFVKLSQHCQRGTANTTHLLAWELGVGLGIASACHLHLTANEQAVYRVGLLSAIVSLAFFVLLTYPYFKKEEGKINVIYIMKSGLRIFATNCSIIYESAFLMYHLSHITQ